MIDPILLDFLLGVGIGFIEEDESITCPHCGREIIAEEIITRYDGYLCPYCLGKISNG